MRSLHNCGGLCFFFSRPVRGMANLGPLPVDLEIFCWDFCEWRRDFIPCYCLYLFMRCDGLWSGPIHKLFFCFLQSVLFPLILVHVFFNLWPLHVHIRSVFCLALRSRMMPNGSYDQVKLRRNFICLKRMFSYSPVVLVQYGFWFWIDISSFLLQNEFHLNLSSVLSTPMQKSSLGGI